MNKSAFSPDGYIINQDYTGQYPYGRFKSDYNGCGWIAIYNLLKSMGQDIDHKLIHQNMNSILPYKGFVGTPTSMMKKVIQEYNLQFREIKTKRAILKAVDTFKYGIFRYNEKGVPHYVAFMKTKDNKFRFFNAEQGREYHICTMEEFFNKHVQFPMIKALVIN